MRKGTKIYHCHGKDKGKILSKHKTVVKAKAAHRAIMANKKKKR